VLDLCGKFAIDEQDQLVLEQYRPYIVMMNTRAAASIEAAEKRYADALRTIDKGLEEIREFFARFGQEESYPQASEVRVLKRLAREVRKKLPVNPIEKLERKLDKAVRDERYEDAARLRDRISAMKSRRGGSKKEVG
jgi:excinuclease UvrABC helicase subunit UvrB